MAPVCFNEFEHQAPPVPTFLPFSNQKLKVFTPLKPNKISYNLNGVDFLLDERYNPKKAIGNGAYGLVIRATDAESGDQVAIKKVNDVFDDLTDAKRILREMKLLNHFDHYNVLNLRDLLLPDCFDNFQDVYMVSDLMESDLHKVLYSNQTLSIKHISYFVYQILCALKHIHSANVIHRDLKPANILVNSDCQVTICDFGLARGLELENFSAMTEYVVTRWYRAPEIIFAQRNYGPAIDVWALGCIFGELLLETPLFPGQNYLEMAKFICEGLGQQCLTNSGFIKSRKGRMFVNEVDYEGTRSKLLVNVLEKANVEPLAIDLLMKLLTFDPSKRISVDEALHHPFVQEFYNEEDMNEATEFKFEEENKSLTVHEIKNLIYKEISTFRASKFQRMNDEDDY